MERLQAELGVQAHFRPLRSVATRTRPSESTVGASSSASGCASKVSLSSVFNNDDRRNSSWRAQVLGGCVTDNEGHAQLWQGSRPWLVLDEQRLQC